LKRARRNERRFDAKCKKGARDRRDESELEAGCKRELSEIEGERDVHIQLVVADIALLDC
jgi:hypothetical protein